MRLKIRKGDEVEVIAGKDRGKRGVVQEVHLDTRRLTVAGVNIAKRHQKPNPQRNLKGGIIEQPAPMDASNVMLVCPHCGRPSRIGHSFEDEEKVRVCRNCGERIVQKEQ